MSTLFDLPVPGIGFLIERMKLVPAYRQPRFLPTLPTPDGNIDLDLAAPEPATAASTLPTCAGFASLAGYRFPPALCACH
jgi:hypothetical protein